MTVEYIDAAYRLPDLTATEINILVYIANAANRDGECWLKRSTIGSATRLHPDTVKTTLGGLAERKLISKKPMTHEGRIVATAIQLLFDPIRPIPESRGRHAPIDRGPRPPTTGRDNGGPPTPGHGGSLTPNKKSRTKEPESPVAPKGRVRAEVSEEAKALMERVWGVATKAARRGCGKDDVARACNAALGRKADPESMVAAVSVYCAGERQTVEDGRYCMSLKRLIEQDRWREWMPEDGDAGGAAPGAPARPAPTPEATAAHLDYVWRTRLEDYRRIGAWKTQYGPKPGEAGCQVPAALLAAAA